MKLKTTTKLKPWKAMRGRPSGRRMYYSIWCTLYSYQRLYAYIRSKSNVYPDDFWSIVDPAGRVRGYFKAGKYTRIAP